MDHLVFRYDNGAGITYKLKGIDAFNRKKAKNLVSFKHQPVLPDHKRASVNQLKTLFRQFQRFKHLKELFFSFDPVNTEYELKLPLVPLITCSCLTDVNFYFSGLTIKQQTVLRKICFLNQRNLNIVSISVGSVGHPVFLDGSTQLNLKRLNLYVHKREESIYGLSKAMEYLDCKRITFYSLDYTGVNFRREKVYMLGEILRTQSKMCLSKSIINYAWKDYFEKGENGFLKEIESTYKN